MAYRMSAAQSYDWTLGGAAAAQVEREILDEILERDTIPWEITIRLDDGTLAFTLELEDVALRPPADAVVPGHPAHRTVTGWEAAGPHGWYSNAALYTVAHGEARVLLRAGNVLRLAFVAPGPITVEEL
jgi:hypothetical protein